MLTQAHLWIISTILASYIDICYTNSYDLTLKRLQVLEVNKDYLQFNMSLNKFSRTKAGITLYFTLLKDLPNETYISVELFGEYSNEYRKLPIRVGRTICETLNMEFLWVKDEILKDGVFPTKCPVKKGFYYTRNFLPNIGNFPSNFPWTNIKVVTNMTLDTGSLLTRSEVYVTLDHDAKYKRHKIA